MNMMRKFFGFLICTIRRKHRRGRQALPDILNDKGIVTRTYYCPRCGKRHSRRLKSPTVKVD